MSGGGWLLAVASLLLVGLALLLLGLGLRARNNEQVVRRLVPGQAPDDISSARPGTQHWLVRRMRRAGIVHMRPWLAGAALVMLALAVPLGRLLNVFGVLLAVLLVLALFNGLLGLLYRRSLQAGRTLGDALEQAVAAADDPLRAVFARASSHVQLGISLPEALQDIAELYEVEELHILALGVAVNYRYGGNTTELLDNIIKVIHEREKIGRQLRAMTGETRFSALVLAVLPLGLGMYILASNPGYLMAMWTDGFGRTLLLASLGLQAVGCVALWRMLKSV